MRWRREPGTRRRLPQPLVPWFVYVGMTLLLPAANGATRREGFCEHALITLGVSGAIVLAWVLVADRRRRGSTAAARSIRGRS